MKRRVAKRRIMVTLMAVMMLMATSVTSFAKGFYGKNVYGRLKKIGSMEAQAYTENRVDGGGYAYASVTVEYLSSNKNLYTTTPVTKTGISSATVTKRVTGGFVSAWSGHGVTNKEFELIIGSDGM